MPSVMPKSASAGKQHCKNMPIKRFIRSSVTAGDLEQEVMQNSGEGFSSRVCTVVHYTVLEAISEPMQ